MLRLRSLTVGEAGIGGLAVADGMSDESGKKRSEPPQAWEGHESDPRPSVAGILVRGTITCQRAALGALGLVPTTDFFLGEKYFRLSEHYRGRILDLGSGRGSYTAFLRSQGHSVVAMDITDSSRHPDVTNHLLVDGSVHSMANKTDTALYMFLVTRDAGDPTGTFQSGD